MKPQHTPTPWHMEPSERSSVYCNEKVPGGYFNEGHLFSMDKYALQEENAAFIVTAVNCHEELLQALKAMTKRWENVPEEKRYQYSERVQSALKAIAKAEGK